MQVIQLPILRPFLNVAEALGFLIVILRLIYDVKVRRFHAKEVLPAEFPVMADLFDPESPPAHTNKPVHYIRMVYCGAVAHG